MTAYETGTEGEKVPLRLRCLQHILCVNPHSIEDLRQLIHKGNVDIPLGVLDHLGRLSHLDRGCEMGAGSDDGAVDCIDILAHLRRGAGGNLLDMLHGVLLIAGIDALGAVATIEVLIELQPGDTLHDRDAALLRHAGVDGALIDDYIALADDLTYHLTGRDKRREVGVVILIHGRGDSHDIEVALPDLIEIRGADEAILDGGLQELIRHLEGGIVTRHQSLYPSRVVVVSDGLVLSAEEPCKWKTHIPEPDDSNLCVLERIHFIVW